MVVIYVVCGHSKLKTLVANIALQQLKGVEATDLRFQDVYCTCKTQWYIIALLLLICIRYSIHCHKQNKGNQTCS